ncbi:MAG: phosphate ABC transporter permease PstA [Chloroflexaceae bacterium]|nr:phosphate ABC transporter permease PstA [Chloroflexaceae bacterium]
MFSGSGQESITAIREAAEKINDYGTIPQGEGLIKNVQGRQTKASVWRNIFFSATIFGLFVLATLLYTIVDDAFGLIAVQVAIEEETIAAPFGKTEVEQLTQEEMAQVLTDATGSSGSLRRMNREVPFTERSQAELEDIIRVEILKEEVVRSFAFTESLFNRAAIEAQVAEDFPRAELRWNSWISWDFLTTPMNSTPALAGIRTGILGTLWVTAIAMLFAIPLGIGAAIYLEEYAADTKNPFLIRFNSLVQTNISNLAGVPSIIYGMLGLAVFVIALGYFTSGQFFSLTGAATNGRTILSAGLTVGLLVLPLIIINGQEAIRAVPRSLRQASYGLGATKWQTVWNVVMPNAIPGMMTGIILAMSRAIGETAPLIVVGASTFILTDPSGVFSQFTTLPIQIFNWTARPQAQFQNAAAAGIIVLLVIMVSLNGTAIWIRNRYQRSG